MKRAFVSSLIIHGCLVVIFGLWLCPWLENRYTADRRAFFNIDVFELADQTKLAGRKIAAPKVSAVKKEKPSAFLAHAEPAPTAPALDADAPLDAKKELVELESAGDGASTTKLSIHDYFRYVVQKNEAPVYPRLSRLKQEEGQVLIRVVVRRDGNLAETVELAGSSGFELLDRVALEAVGRWRFPAYTSARARIEGLIPFQFSLEE